MQEDWGKKLFKKKEKYSDELLWLSEEITLPLVQRVCLQSGNKGYRIQPCRSALCGTACGSLRHGHCKM